MTEQQNTPEQSFEDVRLVTLHLFRHLFASDFVERWVFFVDRYVSALIHSFSERGSYPPGNHTLRTKATQLNGVAISNDGTYLFIGAADATQVWDLTQNQLICDLHLEGCEVSCMDYQPGLLEIGCSNGTIFVWNADSFAMIHKVAAQETNVTSVAMNTRRTVFCSGSRNSSIGVWSLDTGECLRQLRGHVSVVSAMLFVDDTLLSGSDDLCLRIWDTVTGDQSKSAIIASDDRVNRLWDIAVNCDGSLLACVKNEEVVILEWPSMKELSRINSDATRCCFHPCNPDLLVINDDGCAVFDESESETSDTHIEYPLEIYNVRTEGCKCYLGGHLRSVTGLGFTPDGRRLISISCSEQSIRVWDVSDLVSQV